MTHAPYLRETTPADPGRWLRLACASGAPILIYVPVRCTARFACSSLREDRIAPWTACSLLHSVHYAGSAKPRQRRGLTGAQAVRFW